MERWREEKKNKTKNEEPVGARKKPKWQQQGARGLHSQ